MVVSRLSSKSRKTKRRKRILKPKSSVLSQGYSKYRKNLRSRRLSSRSGFTTLLKLPFSLGAVTIPTKTFRTILTFIVSVLGLCVVIVTFVVMLYLRKVGKEIPDPESLRNRDFAEATIIYDRNGIPLYTTFGDENREYVTLDLIPEETKWAVLAAEDADFWDHSGVDLPGIAKIFWVKLKTGEWNRGSSTISQQLVRNTVLFDLLGEDAYKRTVSRKSKEILITLKFEQELSKEEILEYYMNSVFLGGTVYGFQTASKIYFDKDVSELSLAESAMLAGIIQAPGYYSPILGTNPEDADERQEYVFEQLERITDKTGISQEDIDKAREEELVYSSGNIDLKALHFSLWVKQRLIEMYGEEVVEAGGLQVYTTLDYDMQQVAEEEIRNAIDGVDGSKGARENYNVNNAALVAIDPRTGEILTMVGSYDYWVDNDPRIDGNVNVAISPRQIGSTAKPITYLSSFSLGYYPSLLTPDIPMTFGTNYTPLDANKGFKGQMLMRDALLMSRNLSAVYTMEMVGVDKYIETAESLGITTLTDRQNYGLSLTLGAGEMSLLQVTSAYGVFANGGIRNEPTPFLKITDKNGKVLYELDKGAGERVYSEREIYLLNWMLCNESNAPRLGSKYDDVGGQKLCFKTGTTDGPKDLTTFMYYPNLVVGVWAGNNNNEITCGYRNVAGECTGAIGWSETVPLPIAHSFMVKELGQFGQAWIKRPGGIADKRICLDSGLPADATNPCVQTSSVFLDDHVPANDDGHKKVYICRLNGKVASNADDAKKLDLVDEVFVIDLPLANENQTEAWQNWLTGHKEQIAQINQISVDSFIFGFQLPETEECPLGLGENNEPIIGIVAPVVGQTVTEGNLVKVRYSINSLDTIASVKITLGDKTVTDDYNGSTDEVNISSEGLSPSNYDLKVEARDIEDRVGTSSVNIEIVKNEEVTLTITQPEDNYTITGLSNVIVEVTVTGDDTDMLNKMNLEVYNETLLIGTISGVKVSSDKWQFVFNPEGYEVGNYTIQATGYTEMSIFASPPVNIIVQ